MQFDSNKIVHKAVEEVNVWINCHKNTTRQFAGIISIAERLPTLSVNNPEIIGVCNNFESFTSLLLHKHIESLEKLFRSLRQAILTMQEICLQVDILAEQVKNLTITTANIEAVLYCCQVIPIVSTQLNKEYHY